MKLYSLIFFLFLNNFAFAQQQRKSDTENFLNFFFSNDCLQKNIYNKPLKITTIQFEGDYSNEKVYPNKPNNVSVCTVPIEYNKSIHEILSKVDVVYDSTFYQEQIKSRQNTYWNKQKINFPIKLTIVRMKFFAKFYSEINMLSYPLYSKDGNLIIVSYHAVNRKFSISKNPQILIYKRADNKWYLIDKIESKMNWLR